MLDPSAIILRILVHHPNRTLRGVVALSFPTPTRPVRTRFAPSPTGSLHIGGLRTALFNWLFARHYGGQFLLRIEDTDQTRFDPTALQTLVEAMRWAGLNWDEGPEVGGAHGPYVQSERLALYQEWAKWLVDHDKAYYAYETSEELQRMRKEQEARKLPPGYNRQHRTLTAEDRARFEAEGRKPVVRFKMPLEGKTHCEDVVQGNVSWPNEDLQDTVLLKADGFPTYHLAHVVDDYFMQISHVMRAVEWLPSLPLHWQLWGAFGWERPVYMHLPVMLNPNGKGKISKRNPPVDAQGNIIPVMVHDYIKAGYISEAVVNFLANTGWSYGDDIEIFNLEDAIKRFDGSRIIWWCLSRLLFSLERGSRLDQNRVVVYTSQVRRQAHWLAAACILLALRCAAQENQGGLLNVTVALLKNSCCPSPFCT